MESMTTHRRTELIFSGPGVYVPIMGFYTVRWLRNTDGNPFAGVQVNSLEHACETRVERVVANGNYLGEMAQQGGE